MTLIEDLTTLIADAKTALEELNTLITQMTTALEATPTPEGTSTPDQRSSVPAFPVSWRSGKGGSTGNVPVPEVAKQIAAEQLQITGDQLLAQVKAAAAQAETLIEREQALALAAIRAERERRPLLTERDRGYSSDRGEWG